MYVHVPFCKSICYYCDFTHMVYREDMVEEWLNALQKELQHKDIHAQVSTVYIGGGTPTCLSSDQLERLLSLLDVYTTNAEEYTIEVKSFLQILIMQEENMLIRHRLGKTFL